MIRLHRRLEARDDLAILLHDAADVVAANAERAHRRDRPRGRAAGRACQHGDLAEERAGAHAGDGPLATGLGMHDVDLTAAKEIRVVATLALLQDHVAGGEADRAEMRREIRDRLRWQVGKRAVAPQEVRRRPHGGKRLELLRERGLIRHDCQQSTLRDPHPGAWRGRDHARVPRLVQDRGHLPDERGRGHGREGPVAVPGHHPDPARGEDEDVARRIAFPHERLAGREGRGRAGVEQSLPDTVRKAQERSEIQRPHRARA